MRYAKLAAGVAVAMIVGGAALAQDRAAGLVRFLDIDNDERVSLNEYLNFQQPRLAEFDENENGRLSRAEFTASLSEEAKGNAQRSFRFSDQDGNRALDEREFLGYHAYVFNNFLDADRDEFVTAEELAALE
jgi:Ca2+-binding EF-hand superfamily protein